MPKNGNPDSGSANPFQPSSPPDASGQEPVPPAASHFWRTFALLVGPLFAATVGLALYFAGHSADVAWTAGVICLCAVWWIFEPIPIPATSLIPLAVFPVAGVLDSKQVGSAYGDKLVLLMMGGFMISTAMQRSGAHRRLALNMVTLFGGRGGGRRLVFGFMAASAFLSMWISNTATALMLLPIVAAVVEKSTDRRLHVCLLLGIAYAASIGGTATPIGTPPNLLFFDNYVKAGGEEPTFAQWMKWTLPIVLTMLPLTAWWLTRDLKKQSDLQLPEVGKWRTEEIRALVVFAVTALLWVTRKEPFGGWSEWLGIPGANDASVGLLAVVAMHLIPNGKGEMLMTWESASKIPWGVLILYGGGIAIALAFRESGLSETIASSLTGLSAVPVIVMIAGICLAVTFLTEVTSNTATATLLLPILGATALAADMDPKLIMIPATISCSFAFMLPVATPTNAIVFSSDKITIKEMAREGFALNLIGAVVVTLLCYWLLS
ncbi:SLC13 family permease [Planctomycetes bacterium K23_9]|uniref:Sodium-dependent dicarboxylate transporter SdcS n=1 Tax=Stieleria marina TaxID=1930275 RepID=A0A517P0G6_9BACT|nr:Sodium-dependent dicarboxylate transporter SdcS [Planctomycetes bacterium K23_9]